MAELIGFYSVAESQGKKTISQSFADLLAENNHKVLYVELDSHRPSVAISTQITHDTKNVVEYFRQIATTKNFTFESFVLKKEHLLEEAEDRHLNRRIKMNIDDHLDYLIFPLNHEDKDFPTLIDGENAEKETKELIERLTYEFKSSKYDFIILNLPNELYSIFGFELIGNCDSLINVLTPSATRLFENKKAKSFLLENEPSLKAKWNTILNMVSNAVEDSQYNELINDKPILIPFDEDRQADEFSSKIGSFVIKERLKLLAERFNILLVDELPERRNGLRSFLGKRG
jgi:hypothetical protein